MQYDPVVRTKVATNSMRKSRPLDPQLRWNGARGCTYTVATSGGGEGGGVTGPDFLMLEATGYMPEATGCMPEATGCTVQR